MASEMNRSVLEKSLADQGFTVEEQSSAKGAIIVVKAPDGVNQNFFHRSSWAKGTVDGIFSDLRKMGWVDPRRVPQNGHGTPKSTGPVEMVEQYLTDAEDSPLELILPMKGNRFVAAWVCPLCRQETDWPPSRGRHLKSAHGITAKAIGAKTAVVKPSTSAETEKKDKPLRRASKVTTKHIEPESPVVRMRNKVAQAKKAREVEGEAIDWIVAEYEKKCEELAELQKKYDKLYRHLAKGVDLV
jgi:hypothetical protein